MAIFFTDSAALQAVSECPWRHLIHRKTRLSSIVSQPIKVDVVDVVVVVLVVVVIFVLVVVRCLPLKFGQNCFSNS